MAAYASRQELQDYLSGNPVAQLPDEPEVERLLERAQRAVDRVLGRWPLLSTALKLDPGSLDLVQRAALSRATCAACEHILSLDAEFWSGDDDYLPNEVSILRRAQRVSPRMMEELAGHGLIRRSGTVTTILSAAPSEAVAALGEA